MIREVKFIWQNMTYHELKAVLRDNRRLRVFPLVEKPGNTIEIEHSVRLVLSS